MTSSESTVRSITIRCVDAPMPMPLHTGSGALNEQRLYQLIRQSGAVHERLFEIEFAGSGAEAYCFTFG